MEGPHSRPIQTSMLAVEEVGLQWAEHYKFSFIRDDFPAGNYGYPTQMEVLWTLPPTTYNAKGFSEVDPALKPLSGSYRWIMLNLIDNPAAPGFPEFSLNAQANTYIHMRFLVYEITDPSFDSSTPTWNNHGAISKNLVADMEWQTVRSEILIGGPDFPWTVGTNTAGAQAFTLTAAYGFMFEWEYVGTSPDPPGVGAFCRTRFWSPGSPVLGDSYNRLAKIL